MQTSIKGLTVNLGERPRSSRAPQRTFVELIHRKLAAHHSPVRRPVPQPGATDTCKKRHLTPTSCRLVAKVQAVPSSDPQGPPRPARKDLRVVVRCVEPGRPGQPEGASGDLLRSDQRHLCPRPMEGL